MVKFSKQEQEDFNFWMKDGNVSKNSDGSYSTQDAQFGNKLKDMDALKEYYLKEFLSGSRYAGGGRTMENRAKKQARKDIKTHLYRPQAPYQSVEKPSEEWERYELPYDTKMQYDFEPDSLSAQDKRYSEFGKGGEVEYEIKRIVNGAKNQKRNTHFAIHKPTNSIVFTWDYNNYDTKELNAHKEDYFYIDVKDVVSGNVDKYVKSDFAIVQRKDLEKRGIDLNNYLVFVGQKYDKSESKNESDGGEAGFDDAGTSMVMYHEKRGNFITPKGQIYLWLYEGEKIAEKLQNEQYDWVFYPLTSYMMAFQSGYIPPLKRVWTKKFQKEHKGSEHLLGLIKAYLIEKEGKKELFIDMMSVNPTKMKKGIMSYMIKDLRNAFNLSQDQVTFSKLTKEGEKFIAKKQYGDGGGVEPNIYFYNDGEQDITFTTFEEAYNEVQRLGYSKFRDNLGGEYFVNKDLTKKTIYQHKSNPYITLEFLEDTNKGIKGLQKNPKSLSKKERTDGIIVYYSDSEMKQLFDKKYSDGGGVGKSNDKPRFRIIKSDGRIKYAGTDEPSWLNLEKAKKLVDYSKGEMIYEHDEDGNKVWEVFADGGLTRGEIENKIEGLKLRIAKTKKQISGYETTERGKYNKLFQEKVVPLQKELDTLSDLYGKSKYEKGGALKVGSKVGFLRPRTGRYEYAEVLSIDGDNVNLVVRHPKRSQWDNYFTETKERITKFSNTLSEDYDRPVMKVKYADGGDTEENEYRRGGFMYEVQKKGSPSNDMRETMFTAKNLTELKKKIIEKYGTSEGFLVSRRTEQGYYAPVKFEDGGAIYPDLSLIKADVVNDSVVLDEFEIKKTKNTFTINGLENKKIKESSDIVRVLRSLWEKDTINAYEQSYVLYLNKSNNIIGYYHHSSGGIDGTIMDVQMISGMALKSLAKGVIIAHNHPSESTLPSDADKRITNQIKDALKVFNILLLDSIIITDESYFSFCDEGLI